MPVAVPTDIPDADLPGTAAKVNKVLRRMGVEERIVQGRGYVYFTEGEAHTWYSSSIPINRINHMTVRQLIEEYVDLKNAGEEASKDRQLLRDGQRYRLRPRHESSTIKETQMTKELIAAAKARVNAAEEPSFDSSLDALKAVFSLLPGLEYKVVKNSVSTSIGVYDWDDLDMETDEIKETIQKAGFKFMKQSEDAIHFQTDLHFVVFAQDMGVVMAGSL
jgi:hypothetical protein